MSMSQKQGLYRSALFLNTLLYRSNIPNIYQYMPTLSPQQTVYKQLEVKTELTI